MSKKFKNNILRIVSLTICLVFVLNFVLIGENVFADDSVIDFEETGLEQFTYSKNGGVEIKSDDGNKFLNVSPKVDGISIFLSYNFTPESGIPVELSYDFIINNDSNSGVTIASVSEGMDQFLKIDAMNNKLYYTNASNEKISFADNVYNSQWYRLRLIMDFTNNTYDVYLDDVCIIKNQASNATYSYDSKNVKYTMSTKYSPGFSIDNFLIANSSNPSTIAIEGDDVVSVANDSSASFEYLINFYDGNSNLLENVNGDFSCLIKPENKGVSVSNNDNKLVVEVSETAPSGEYELFAISGSMVGKKVISIERFESFPETVEILGNSKIAYGFNGNTYPFEVNVINQVGDSINWGKFFFALEGDVPEGISVDEKTGVVTVTKDLPKDHRITLKAVSERDAMVYGTKNLTLEDAVTYSEDEYRLNAIINHVENIYTYGSDPYNGLPLIGQVIDRVSFTPGEWPETQDIIKIPANQASLSQFQRTCDALYLITGDKKYRERVDDSNKFFFDNYMSVAGIPYWGGHMFIDLQTGEANRNKDTGGKDIHEMKGHDPFMESFFRVAPEQAEGFIISFISQHITDWDTMNLSRHGSFDKLPDIEKFNANTQEYIPSNVGYSPVYTQNLGFRESLHAIGRLCSDWYRHTKDERAAVAFMRIHDSFWKVASPDPDYWLDVAQNSTAGRKGYPDEAVEGLSVISEGPPGQPGKWWLLDPIPGYIQMAVYGDRLWRAMGDDLIDQGFITEEEQWKVRECYNMDSFSSASPLVYWDFIDAIGDDHEFAPIVRERAIRNVANYMRLAYNPETRQFKRMLIDGTDVTGFIYKRNGYLGGAGKVANPSYGNARYFLGAALTYARALNYRDENGKLIYEEQINEIWPFLKNYAEDNDLGCIGTNSLGDEGMDLNLTTTTDQYEFILSCVYLWEGTGRVEFLDLGRALARNYIENHEQEGFLVLNKGNRYIFTGGKDSNPPYMIALLEAAIRGELDKCSNYMRHSGWYESGVWMEHLGEQRQAGSEDDLWNVPMPSVLIKEINITKDEIELKVGETYNVEHTVYPSDTKDKGVQYSSSDNTCVLATVNSSKIVAVAPGTAEIMVRSTNDFTIYDILKVKVIE